MEYQSNGTLDRYNARLVAKEYTQTYEIIYEMFTLVEKMYIVRIILSLASHFGSELHLFDVKNAFLRRDLEEVYMEISLDRTLLMEGIRCVD